MADDKQTVEIPQAGNLNLSELSESLNFYGHLDGGEGEGADGNDAEEVGEGDEEGAEYADEEAQDADDEGEDDESGDDSDEDQESELDDDEDDDDDSDDDEEGEDEDEEEAKQDKTKLVARTKDGKKIVVPKDATVTHKVDGEEVQLKVQDLLNDYSGRSVIERRLKEVDFAKQEAEHVKVRAETVLKDYEETFNQMAAMTMQGKPEAVFDMIANITGQNPVDFVKQLLGKAQEWGTLLSQMTEEQKAAYFTQQELRWLEVKKQREQQEMSRLSTQRQIDGYVSSKAKELGFIEAEFYAKVNELAKDGKLIQSNIQERADFVIGELLNNRHTERVEKIVRSFGKRVTPQLKQVILENTTTKDSDEDIRYALKELLKEEKTKTAKTLSKKVRSNNKALGANVKGSEKQKAKSALEGKTFTGFQDIIDSSY